MPVTSGFNHVATVTADLDRAIDFYRAAFDAEMIYEVAAAEHHRRMAIIDLGGGSTLNIAEHPADTIIGERTRSGSRGPIDHYGLSVASRDTLEDVRARLIAAGADIGEIQQLGHSWSLFFRDPDGMELEVCAPLG
jgi:catechol 2,3-dioxygenase-like lactoylglutathione lyase family enzyme